MVDIERHVLDTTQPKLADRATSEAENCALFRQNHGVHISAGCVHDDLRF